MIKRSCLIPLFLVSLIVVLPALFNNCSSDAVNFSNSSKITVVSNEQTGGSGEGYLGKPEPEIYDRKFPDYQCQNVSTSQGILNVSTNNAVLEKDLCDSTSYNIQFADPELSFTRYNPDFITFKRGIFEKRATVTPALTNVTEAFCRYVDNSVGIDVIIRSPSSSAQSGKIIIGQAQNPAQGFNGAWSGKSANLFSLSSQLNGNVLTYSSTTQAFALDM